jgi:hypothetical protein
VQVALSTPHGTKQPDYVLFPDAATRAALPPGPVSEAELAQALAVADAKRWERKLDQASDGAERAAGKGLSQNPSTQIDFYIRHSGLAWGVLTNGRQWRLYQRDSSRKLDVYYEIDLPALLEQDDADAFGYFYHFFRRAAFERGGWLESVLAESAAYQRGVGDNLKEQVYDALRALAQGFLAYPGNAIPADPDAATLQAIYDNALIVLYRILFILYAESRDLLPVHTNELYRAQYSFDALKQRIKREEELATPAGATVSRIWGDLTTLWRIIDAGNAELGVPAYNGGLFSARQHPFLEQHQVGDRHLRRAIDLLARTADPASGRREFVDYRDLSVRHLGSIYEGLLEYQLRVAAEPLRVRRADKKELYAPPAADDSAPPDVAAGEAYLVTDKGERKATGSYYTPDYIVQYIVEQTLGPVLEAAAAPYRDADGAVRDAEGLAQAILALNVLDPAMGSGHFLVAATDFMARFLVALELPQAGAEGAGSDLAYWRRRVVQACIYGVDLNPLAVELAKLSLWLNTIARDKPLNFLDHHLRCGNSLIGARAQALLLDAVPGGSPRRRGKSKAQKQQAAGQLALLGDAHFTATIGGATGVMDRIEALAGDDLQQIRQAEQLYTQQARAATRPYRQLADVWTARHFGLELDDALWQGLTAAVLRQGFEVPAYQRILQQAEKIAEEYRFFHWELEFPEVFFNEEGELQQNSGFDVVVGNPPYIVFVKRGKGRQSDFIIYQEVSGGEIDYYSSSFPNATEYAPNAHALMTEQSFNLLGSAGFHGFIYPASLLYYYTFKGLREYLTNESKLQAVIQIEHVFDEAETGGNAVVIFQKQRKRNSRVKVSHLKIANEVINFVPEFADQQAFSKAPWNRWFTDARLLSVLDKTQMLSSKMENFGDFYQGVCTGNNAKWLTNDASNLLAKKVLRGRDINRYLTDWNGVYLIFDKPKMWSNTNESLLRSNPKLLIRQTGDSLIASLDTEGLFLIDSLYLFRPSVKAYNPHYLLSVFNSKLINALYQFYCPEMDRAFAQVKIVNLRPLPIRRIDFTTPTAERAQLLETGQSHYGRCLQTDEPTPLLDFTRRQLDAGRSDVVHDLLAYLAEQMIALNRQRQALARARDPFKYVDRAAPFRRLGQVLGEAIKYGRVVADAGADLDRVHHDIDAMRLAPAPDGGYQLDVQLKLRDPQQDWRGWQYEPDGNNIRRAWVTAYHFPTLAATQARFYQVVLPHRAEFVHAGAFPGGVTRTTAQKLVATTLPAFDPGVDLTPLLELDAELAQVESALARTDGLIDQIVYRLYGLTAEEIGIVAGDGG